MSGATAGNGAGRKASSNAALFFRRWLANPLQMGSVVLSSPSLCRRIAALVRDGLDEAVLEIGAGTGAVSRALLGAGVPPERLVAVEIVPDMAEHLRRALPGVEVLCGDAFNFARALPGRWHRRIGTAICGIPLMLPFAKQRRFVDAVEAVAPDRGFFLYTYCVTRPLPHRKLGLAARPEAWTPCNLPSASVWRYWHNDVRAPS